MDPTACVERLLDAYGENDFLEIQYAADDLLTWIRNGGCEMPELTEPQLSALLIMVRGYSKRKVTEHCDGASCDHSQ